MKLMYRNKKESKQLQCIEKKRWMLVGNSHQWPREW